ncbi:hypothetical protein [Streptomyces cyaneogriseus]|nr:hypothetical protein [Streptomyces cyaneogriseus]
MPVPPVTGTVPSASNRTVITSYSIHYTKLYETPAAEESYNFV